MSKTELNGFTGHEIPGFQLLREIGQGSNGIVYLAKQLLLDREVACKILLPEYSSSPEYIKCFVHEARLVARLEHPNIVQALDVGSTATGISYFVMEYVPGRSLEEIRLEEPERLTPEFLLDTFISLADALDYAWKFHSITHGDIKPGNLLIRDADDVLKLADLGLARINGATPSGEIMATPLYVAPEVIRGERGGVSSDIYSFGVMLYELLSGRPPFRGDIDMLLEQHQFCKPDPMIVYNPDIEHDISLFADRLLAKSPEERPKNWSDIKNFLIEVRRRRRSPRAVNPRVRKKLDMLASGTPKPASGAGVLPLMITATVVILALLGLVLFWLLVNTH